MKLRDYVIEQLAEMVVGDNGSFPYRSSMRITQFFQRCGHACKHDGSTRKWWAKERLQELNLCSCQNPDLPSDDLLRIISEMFDPDDFDRGEKSRETAIEVLNRVLGRQGLAAYFDPAGQWRVRNTGTGVETSIVHDRPRPLSAEEIAQRNRVSDFLDSASEDDFTEHLLVPFFQRLGFHRVSATGHKEKALEFGKDLWMKFQLPTGHWIYFCAQVKREKLDARAASPSNNTATVLNQVRMAVDHPIFDPDTGRRVLVDHVFVISAGEITRSARSWLVDKLDQSQRRQLIFMDRDEFLDHSARILLDLRIDSADSVIEADGVPF